jgi:starch phosphorylase
MHVCLQRYLTLKSMSAAEKKKVNPRVVFFAGKAAPAYYIAKLVRTVRPMYLVDC